jgi:chromosomal replication initiator protein
LLILDDLQFFCGKKYTQVELLYTIDSLVRDGRQLVLAGDRPPREMGDLGPELATRLESGMVCLIEPPDQPTRLGIVMQMARRMNLSVPPEVAEYVAGHLTRHARELSGALCRLKATGQATGKPITIGMAEEGLADLIRTSTRVVGLADIEKAVCKTFDLQPRALQSDCRSRRVSYPRMLAMWLARKYTRSALSEIGQHFGRRSHATVISAQKRVDSWRSADSSIQLANHTWNVNDAIRQAERSLQAG